MNTNEELPWISDFLRDVVAGMPEAVARYDGIEIAAVLDDGDGCLERIDNPRDLPDAAMFSVYFHLREGGCECVADFATADEARAQGDELGRLTGWSIDDQIPAA